MARPLLLKAAAALAVLLASPAVADTRWVVCSASDPASNRIWVSDVYEDPGASVRDGQDRGWANHVRSKFQLPSALSGSCSVEETREDALWRHAVLTDQDPVRPVTIVELSDWQPEFGRKADMRVAELPPETLELASLDTNDMAPAVAAQTAVEQGARIGDEAEFQRQYAEYQRRLADQQRAVEAWRQAQADLALRQKRQQLAAASAVAAYAQQARAHDAEVTRYRMQLATLGR